MSEITLEEALSMVDGGPHHIGEWAQAATTLAAEVRRLQAIAYPPQDGSEFAKLPYKQMYEAAMELIGEFNKAMAELQAENARMRGWRLDLYPDDPNAEAAEKGANP